MRDGGRACGAHDPADRRGPTPLVQGHVSPYGAFDLDMVWRLDLEVLAAAGGRRLFAEDAFRRERVTVGPEPAGTVKPARGRETGQVSMRRHSASPVGEPRDEKRTDALRALLACLVTLLLALADPPAVAASVGFAVLQVPAGSEPPLEVGVWYPADAPSRPTAVGLFAQDVAPGATVRGRSLPLVVISHGNGGNFASHADTALALAQAGFIVAAPTHTGDNNRDQSRATDIAGRTRQLAAVTDHLAARWSPGTVDPARIGAFGFSTGGFTVLAAAGGVPDFSRVGPHCAANPGLYDCRLLAAAGTSPAARTAFVRDGRFRALVVAAPALGYTFAPAGLATVTVPVQLWAAAEDTILPSRLYAEPVRAALPHPPEVHVVERAGHFDFLAPCSEALARAASAICGSAPGFDRAEFHGRFNAAVARFLSAALPP